MRPWPSRRSIAATTATMVIATAIADMAAPQQRPALSGAAIAAGAAERDRERYYADREWDEYCFSKYRSYDPRTGTYLGHDGYRHPCR